MVNAEETKHFLIWSYMSLSSCVAPNNKMDLVLHPGLVGSQLNTKNQRSEVKR